MSSIFAISPIATNAQDILADVKPDTVPSFSQLIVTTYLDANISYELDMLITESEEVYVNIENLFQILNIPCNPNFAVKSLEGFIENETKSYSIDYGNKQIKVGNNMLNISDKLIEDSGGIYLESATLASAFGLTITFNQRSLTAKLSSSFELPVYRQMRMATNRQNITTYNGAITDADTTIDRSYHLFRFGAIDWSINSSQIVQQPTNNYISLGIGTEMLFGQANFHIYHNDGYKFDKRQIQYNWRWVDNNKTLIRQAQLGLIYNRSISFLNSPVIGASISNSPTTVRKATGHYFINETTEPNWTVELYINDVLTDYTTADASGLYVFKVPIVYGYTLLKLKFYGPLGEERMEERTMNVPFTFTPANTIEYGFVGGVLQNDIETRYGHGVINYGATRFLTIGGGLEYLSRIPNSPSIPFAKVAFQPFNSMTLHLEYAHDVRMTGLLNYHFTKNAFLEIDYAKYKEGQFATEFNALEERKVRLLVPLKLNKVTIFSKVNFNQLIYKPFSYNQFDFVLSAYYKRTSANATFVRNWVNNNNAYQALHFSTSYRLRKGLVIRPSLEFDINKREVTRARAEIEKRIKKVHFILSAERNFISRSNNYFLSARYDLPFARVSFIGQYNNGKFGFSELAQGSLTFGGGNGYVKAGNNSSLSKGGIVFYPFLDLNQNGIHDDGEQRILLSSARVSGGKAVISEKDSLIRVSDLNAFVEYQVEFSENDLDNISWRFNNKSYLVLVDPNQYKKVPVPVFPAGEVSGMVYLDDGQSIKGQGRVTVQIFSKYGRKVAETLSESDGYYTYLGLKPGDYMIRVDAQQLEKLGFQALPIIHQVSIGALPEGDVRDGLDFIIKSEAHTGNNSDIQQEDAEDTLKKLGDEDVTKGNTIEPVSNIKGMFYGVQIGVYRNQQTAEKLLNLSPIFFEKLPNGLFRYIYGQFASNEEALTATKRIRDSGIKDAFVVAYKDGAKIDMTEIQK